jgi:hypothetical protein
MSGACAVRHKSNGHGSDEVGLFLFAKVLANVDDLTLKVS